MKIRMHKGGLAESMETTCEIEPTLIAVREKLVEWYGDTLAYNDITLIEHGLSFIKYGLILNTREWATHMIMSPSGVLAYTDGLVTEQPKVWTDKELTDLYDRANNIMGGKRIPLTSQSVFNAMRLCLKEGKNDNA